MCVVALEKKDLERSKNRKLSDLFSEVYFHKARWSQGIRLVLIATVLG